VEPIKAPRFVNNFRRGEKAHKRKKNLRQTRRRQQAEAIERKGHSSAKDRD
jgi:hypothetical protein